MQSGKPILAAMGAPIGLCAVYASVDTSTDTSKDIDAQVVQCTDFARRVGLTLREPPVFAERDASSIPLRERPALEGLRGLVRRREISGVLVAGLVRLARSEIDLASLFDEFLHADIAIYVTSEPCAGRIDPLWMLIQSITTAEKRHQLSWRLKYAREFRRRSRENSRYLSNYASPAENPSDNLHD